MKTLYIIGNGFDLHHGINSSYANYRDWLKENDYDTYNQMVETFGACEDDDWWFEFEQHLADVDIRVQANEIASENQPDYGSDEYRDRDLYAGEIEAENKFSGITDNIRSTFAKWINSLNTPDDNLKIEMDINDSFCITFNYTHALEDLYGFSSDKVLHIHGDKDDDYHSLVLGHNETDKELEEKAEQPSLQRSEDMTDDEWFEYQDEESDDLVMQQTIGAVIRAVSSLRKDTEGIIIRNSDVFHSLADVKNVNVYGMSFSPIDLPYLVKISHSVSRDAKWTIYYHGTNDISRIDGFVEKYLGSDNVNKVDW